MNSDSESDEYWYPNIMFQKTLGLFLNEIVASEILEFPINVDDEGALYAAAQFDMENPFFLLQLRCYL